MGNAFSTLSRTQLKLLQALVNADVEFMLIGGYAVRFHGYLREAEDLDLFVSTDSVNTQKITDCLSGLGAQNLLAASEHLKTPKNKIDWQDVDILTSIHGGSYSEMAPRVVDGIISQLKVKIISKEDLLRERKHSILDESQLERREKIRIDYEHLENCAPPRQPH